MQTLTSFLHALAEEVAPEVKFKPVLGGSMSEGTRVIEASEGDYVLELEQFSLDMFQSPETFTYDRCFVQLKCQHAHQISQDLSSVLSDGFLSRRKVFVKAYSNVSQALSSLELWREFSMLFRLSCMDVRPDDQSIRNLELIYHDENFLWLPLDVDLAPAINCPTWYPPWCRKDPLHQTLLQKHGCRIVAKFIPAAYKDATLFRIGFGKSETELMWTMPAVLKECYKLAKIMKGKVCPLVSSWFEEPDVYITSYHMKTAVFGMYHDYLSKKLNIDVDTAAPGTQQGMENVAKCTAELFNRLEKAYREQVLEHFWIPGQNLLQEKEMYGKYGNCAANYAGLISWILQPELKVPEFV